MGLFDPHPDYPFTGPKELTVDGRTMEPLYLSYFGEQGLGLRIAEWPIKAGQMVTAGDPAALIVTEGGGKAGCIRVARGGMISAVPGSGKAVPAGPLFTLLYYEDGADLLDPFADIAGIGVNLRATLEKQYSDIESSTKKIALGILGAAFVLGIIAAIAGSIGAAGVIILLGVGVTIASVIPKGKKLNNLKEALKKYSPQK